MIAMDVELAAKPMNPKTNWPTPLIHQLQQDHVSNEELSLINLVFCKNFVVRYVILASSVAPFYSCTTSYSRANKKNIKKE